MIVLAIVATVAAVLWTLMVLIANGMSDGPTSFKGGLTLYASWAGVLMFWLAWFFK